MRNVCLFVYASVSMIFVVIWFVIAIPLWYALTKFSDNSFDIDNSAD